MQNIKKVCQMNVTIYDVIMQSFNEFDQFICIHLRSSKFIMNYTCSVLEGAHVGFKERYHSNQCSQEEKCTNHVVSVTARLESLWQV
jgi:hypothetical protein